VIADLFAGHRTLSGVDQAWLIAASVGLIYAFPRQTSNLRSRRLNAKLPRYRWFLLGTGLLGFVVTVAVEALIHAVT
jgi:hypothetical protein